MEDNKDTDRLLTLKQLADKAGVSRTSLYRLVHQAENPMPHYRIGKSIRLSWLEFLAWLQKSPIRTKEKTNG